ncbi:MAG: 2-oxoacid:acceptor oxidoreductase subunit alpha, partial [Chloroflexi bacterium]|nr:2-oxoacid:acceptor oxidoreductase subunit alpha [Chloroflexota bacterium]
LWPFPAEAARRALGAARRLVAVEGNVSAQLVTLIRSQIGLSIEETVLRHDGRGLSAQYILRNLEG